MKRYVLTAGLAFLMSASFALKPGGEHLKGYIDDSMCAGGANSKCTAATRVECAKKCIKGGALAVLVVGDKVYKITNQKKAIKFAGKNVTVDGDVNDDTIMITKISEEKS